MNIPSRFSLSLLFLALAGCGASDGNVVVAGANPSSPPVVPTAPPTVPTGEVPVSNPVDNTPVSNPVDNTPVSNPVDNTPVSNPVDNTPTEATPDPSASNEPSILSSSGTFDNGFDGFITTSTQPKTANGDANFTIENLAPGANPWDIQMWHSVGVQSGQQYTICYKAKAANTREIEVNIDDNDPTYASVLGSPINGAVDQTVSTVYQAYSHTFTASKSASNARLTFNLAQENGDVQLDDIGIFKGAACGLAGVTAPEPEPITDPPPVVDDPWTIEKIGCNDPDDYTGNALVLFDGSGPFDGSFGNKNFSSDEFANLSRQGAQDYVLSSAAVNDASCRDRQVHTGTWVKKIADADSQHSNFVNKFSFDNNTIGDIDHVVIELRINSALTDVPTPQELTDKYGSVIGANGIKTVDNGNVTFAIVLGDPDAATDEVRGEVFLDLDQALYSDQWIRVTVPKDAFFFWQNENWRKTPVSLDDANSVVPTRIAFLPETKGNGAPTTHGYTVRNVVGYNEWTNLSVVPEEDFKEMNISIRTFEVRLKSNGSGQPTPPVATVPPAETTPPVEVEPPVETTPPTVEPEPVVSAQERQARIAAGEAIFKTGAVACTACHGANGNSGAFGSILLSNSNNICTTCSTSYDDLVNILENGVPGSAMPACEPEGNCATQLADYVWGGLNGKALSVVNASTPVAITPNTAPATGFIVEDFEQSALNTVPEGWRTFVGYVPDNNNSASQVFVDDTRAYTGAKSLKVDGGTGPAQIVKAIPAGVERVYMRAWIYMDRAMGSDSTDNHDHIFAIKQDENGSFSANNEIRVGQGKGHLGFNLVPDSDAISPPANKWFTGPQTPVNQWYCAEAAFITDTAFDEVHFYVDGELVNSAKSAADWHAPVTADWLEGDLGFAAFGWQSFSQHETTMWIDDIVVSEQPIGCE